MNTELVAPNLNLPEAVTRRGIDEAQWRTLMNSLYPGAKSDSVLMVLDYCKARKLDPMKKPCHIVPIKVKDGKTGNYDWRDVVMAGIYEYRTTAMRTGNYLGHSKPEFGPVVDTFGVSAPEWCEMTFYRRASNGERIEFPVRVYFRESCATKFDKDTKATTANERWSKAPIQMLTKCAEAAGLREAFPDEFGGETTAEEMEGRDQVIEAQVVAQPIKAAERKSEQKPPAPPPSETPAATTTEAAKPAEPEPPAVAPADTGAPVNVGTIDDITEHGESIVVKLSTGFTCSTKVAALKESAKNLKEAKRIVELTTTKHADPKYMDRLDEILPVSA